MSEYIKHTWQEGETIDAAKLNNIETGIVEAKKEAEGKLTAPTPGTVDEGSFLQVVNGKPAWVTMQSAEGASF